MQSHAHFASDHRPWTQPPSGSMQDDDDDAVVVVWAIDAAGMDAINNGTMADAISRNDGML